MKIHTIIPDALYQRGEFGDFPLQHKLNGLQNYGIDVIVNVIPRLDAELVPYLYRYIHQPMPDGKIINRRGWYNLAQQVIQIVDDGHAVLVHCHAGKNRSGFLNCLVVMGLLNMTGTQALAFVRKGRPNSLGSNEYFQLLLHSLNTLEDLCY